MRIKLTPEQIEELKNDGYMEIEEPENKTNVYLEFSKGLNFTYCEIRMHDDNTQTYCFDEVDLKKLKPRKPIDPSYYNDRPLCPTCQAYMIVNYPCCPICGQAIDWRERS